MKPELFQCHGILTPVRHMTFLRRQLGLLAFPASCRRHQSPLAAPYLLSLRSRGAMKENRSAEPYPGAVSTKCIVEGVEISNSE